MLLSSNVLAEEFSTKPMVSTNEDYTLALKVTEQYGLGEKISTVHWELVHHRTAFIQYRQKV